MMGGGEGGTGEKMGDGSGRGERDKKTGQKRRK